MSWTTPYLGLVGEVATRCGPRSRRVALGPRLEAMRRSLAWLCLIVGAIHCAGFGLLWLALHSGAGTLMSIGTGLTAYAFGLRHAFDADHIAAIDNTTRKLRQEGRQPLAVGLFFALGHSTVVLLVAAGLALGANGLSHALSGTRIHDIGAYVGTSLSAAFLIAIGLINLVILIGIIRSARNQHRADEPAVMPGGIVMKLVGPLFKSLHSPWQMYGVGFLFGLGFDTATEIALLALAAGSAAGGLPWYATLSLPLLFAAGMSLMDSLDGIFVSSAYGWAMSNPSRKIYYNLSITSLSVAIALLIGTLETVTVVARALKLSGGMWDLVTGVNLSLLGIVITASVLFTWLVGISVWRLRAQRA